jgi:metal-responsive CopG/Arc/MetJ family transcriptional regulator
MTIARQLNNRFEEKLAGPLGPTPIAFTLRHCLEIIVELRGGGATWEQIVQQINPVLKNANRTPMSADTLRGMVARERRMATKRKALRRSAEVATTATSASTMAGLSSVKHDLQGENLMNGESKISAGSSLQQAADMAAALEQIKGI